MSGDGAFSTPDHLIQIVSSGVTAVACGEIFTIFLRDNGSLWGFGWNGDGNLGDGTRDNMVMRPKQIVAGGVVAMAAGYYHSLFVKSDGSLWGMGNNGYGQLGIGTNQESLLPVEIASDVVRVAAGARHTLFIKNDGSLWAMGENGFGKLGDCTINWANRPELVVSNGVVAVAAGYDGSLFLKKDGSLWGMGINWGSDYGEGIEFSSHCPEQIFGANNSALVAGYYYNAQLKTCVSIWAGKFNNNPAGVASANYKIGLPTNITNFPGYNLMTIAPLEDGHVRLTYYGTAGVNYALERSSSLANPKWVSLITNTAPNDGVLVITNTPDTTVNNFWRIRAAQKQ